MPVIAIVEDERLIAEILASYLEREGFQTARLHTGREATDWLAGHDPDLVILDLMLPDIDGLTLARSIRSRSMTPIIIATARVEEIDRLLGLELGADDYVCKPFSPREVVARVKAVLRRTSSGANGPGANGPGANGKELNCDLRIDEAQFLAWWRGRPLDLTPTEFRLLHALARRPNHVLSRSSLLDAVSDRDRDVVDRSIDSHIKNLRRKLATAASGISGNQDMIVSVYGVGYRLAIGAPLHR